MGMCFSLLPNPSADTCLTSQTRNKEKLKEEEEEEAWKMQQGAGAREHRRCCPSIPLI